METQSNKVKLRIDGKDVLVDEGITILDAAGQNGIRIPTLCHHPALSSWGGCRMCVVEVDGSPKLAASCVTPVRNGMEVVTSNAAIIESRRTILEFIFAERNHNCMFCPQSGDCEIQKLAYELQMDHLTVSFSFNPFPVDVTSDYMAIDHNRCILCGRCVRACKEIAGASVLNFQNRGPKSLIGMDLNETREQSTCYYCGVCMQVCPTGAMTNRYRGHYAVKGHPKDWQEIESVCSQCGLLCPTTTFVKDNGLLKIEGKLSGDNGRPDRGQLCYRGRFEALKNKRQRLDSPMIRDGKGAWKAAGWDEILGLVSGRLNDIKQKEGGKAIFGLASSEVSNEDLVFFRDLMKRGWSAGYLDTFDGIHFRTVAGAWKEAKETNREASWKIIPDADVIILIGASPYHGQPVISSLLRKGILQQGQKLAVFGRTDPVPPYASHYFPVTDERLPLLIQALKAGMAGTGAPSGVLEKAGLDPDAAGAFREVVKALSDAVNPLFIVGEKLTALQNTPVLAGVIGLAREKGLYPDQALRLIILKPCANSAGAWKLEISSPVEPPANIHWKGGLVLLGEPDDPYLPTLQGLDRVFVAAISPYFPETLADKVDALIPKPPWTEEAGTFTSLSGLETAFKPGVLQAAEGIMSSWQIFQGLAGCAGFQPDYRSREELSKRAGDEIRDKVLYRNFFFLKNGGRSWQNRK